MSSKKNPKESPSNNIITKKRKVPKKDIFVEMEDTAYETLNIPRRKIQTGQYLKEFLKETSSTEEVIKAIRLTIDALLDSIASNLKALSAAALVPHPESTETKAIVRGPLNREIVKKILGIFRKYPPVINDLLGSDEEVKFLDTGIGYVVLENCQKDNYLVGIVQNQKDVDELSRKLRHVQNVVVDNTLLIDDL